MNSPAAPGTIEEHIALLQKLAGSLAQAQHALMQSDVRSLGENTLLQSNLCEQLRALRTTSGAQLRAEASPRWRELSGRLAEAEKQVRHLNAVYGALLRRALRSVQIMQNLCANALGTYYPPDAQRPSGPQRSI